MAPTGLHWAAAVGLLLGGASASSQREWNYDPSSAEGPMYWATHTECTADEGGANNEEASCALRYATCAGQRQSPIDIVDEAAEARPEAFLRVWIGTRAGETYDKIVNNGRGIEIEMFRGEVELVSSLFPDNMVLTRVQHKMPAEHLLDGVRHELEQQFVFSPKDAVVLEEGRPWTINPPQVIVSLLYSVGADVTAGEVPALQHSTINQTISHFPRIPRKGHTLYLFNFNPLLDVSRDTLYVYDGSSTAPPCAENVKWIVSEKLHMVSNAELRELRKGQDHVAPPPHGNARPEMPVGHRRVTKHRLKNPTRTPQFAELMEESETSERKVSGHAGVASAFTSEKDHRKETLRLAAIGLGVILAMLIAVLLVQALKRYNMVPLVIIPAWLGGSLKPEQEQWTTQFRNEGFFGLYEREAYDEDEEEYDDEEDEEEYDDEEDEEDDDEDAE